MDNYLIFRNKGYFLLLIFYICAIGIGRAQVTEPEDEEDIPDKFIVFPNAFTPNPARGNGGTYSLNSYSQDYRSTEVFYPVWSGVSEKSSYTLQIFNRWGELIFQSNDLKQGWDGYVDGKIVPQGTYIYKVSGSFIDDRIFTKIGEVHVIL